jgi:anti-sigma B factor antagonist
VSITGETDLMGLEGMELKFIAHTVSRRKPTLIYLSGVGFIASLGLRPLLSTAKGLKRHGVKMVLLNPQRPGENVLKTSGFGENIPVVHDYNEAIKPLKTGGVLLGFYVFWYCIPRSVISSVGGAPDEKFFKSFKVALNLSSIGRFF